MRVKYAKSLKKGDRTPHYTVIEDAREGTSDTGLCIIVAVEWNDGGQDYRVWDNPHQMVEVVE